MIKRLRKLVYFDKRHFRWWWQRRTRGFDDRDLWDLGVVTAKLILPRLKAYKNCHMGYPGCFSYDKKGELKKGRKKSLNNEAYKKWDDTLDKMIYAFEMKATQDDWDLEIDDKERNKRWSKIDEGLNLFAKYFNALWD
jgi:hypothetical protein